MRSMSFAAVRVAIAAVAFVQMPQHASGQTMVEYSAESRFQLDLHVPDAAMASFLPAGWTLNVSTQGAAKDANLRAIFVDRVTIKVGGAVASLEQTTGYFDVVFIDVDKDGYPAALQAAAPRVRRGGYLIADNVLWSGKVVDDGVRDEATEGIRHFNRTLFALQEFRSVIVPLRDGVAIARREG